MLYVEPCTTANQITYEYFCVLGGLSDDRARKIQRQNGTHVYFTYHYLHY
jgi:hypothetical protein